MQLYIVGLAIYFWCYKEQSLEFDALLNTWQVIFEYQPLQSVPTTRFTVTKRKYIEITELKGELNLDKSGSQMICFI